MSEEVVRVDIPCGGSAKAAFLAFRAWAEQVAASKGRTLGPAWYEDDPENRPKPPEEKKDEGVEGEEGGADHD